jgi:hypothetical protein
MWGIISVTGAQWITADIPVIFMTLPTRTIDPFTSKLMSEATRTLESIALSDGATAFVEIVGLASRIVAQDVVSVLSELVALRTLHNCASTLFVSTCVQVCCATSAVRALEFCSERLQGISWRRRPFSTSLGGLTASIPVQVCAFEAKAIRVVSIGSKYICTGTSICQAFTHSSTAFVKVCIDTIIVIT